MFPAGRVATLPGPELVHLDLERRFDLTGPFREHLDQLGGVPAISAWPFTIGSQPTPKRCESSARSTDW